VSRGLAESRSRAQALIMAGAVFSGQKKLAKAGEMLSDDAALDVRGKDHPWVSRGAAKVYAVDVGTNQLAWKLRQDPRVVVHERTNARSLDAAIIPEPVDIVVCDASFIGLSKVLEAPLKLAKPGAQLVALVKPQFEAGRAEVGKGGVVRDSAVHERVCAEASAWVEGQGWRVLGIEPSPITGPEGNVEFLLGAKKNG
jgi:23S rRNA (cytidine1920-2'-O)/16S rRNA (cytidine1409-2'-O)-methyltransferase